MRSGILGLTLLVSCSVPLRAAAQEPTKDLEPRVERLEKELAALRSDMNTVIDALRRLDARLAESLQSDLEAAGGDLEERLDAVEAETAEVARVARRAGDTADSLSAGELSRINLNVYGTFTAVAWEGEDAVFDAESFELVFSGRPHERLGFFSELEFERAATVGAERGGEVLVEQAYASFSVTSQTHLRAGVILVPFGNYNADHYAPNRDVISRPLVTQIVAPADWTDNGFGVSGDSVLGNHEVQEGATIAGTGPGWSLSYEAYLVAGLDADVTALGARAGRQPFGFDNNNDKALAGHLALHRGGDFELGLSLYRGDYDDTGDLNLLGSALDVRVRKGAFTFTGEVDRFDAERRQRDARLEGLYGRLIWDLHPAFLSRGVHGRLFPGARLTLVAQYDWVQTRGPLVAPGQQDEGEFVALREERWTFGINYRPSYQWVLKLNYERNRGRDSDLYPILYRGDLQGVLVSVGFQF